MIEIETERLTLKKLWIADNELYLNKGGVGYKTNIKLLIYHPINLKRVENRFVNLFNQGKEKLKNLIIEGNYDY